MNQPLMVEGRRDGGFVVRYERSDKVWKRVWVSTKPGWGYHTHREVAPEKRASAVVHADDGFVLPFDDATVEDLRYYLNSRAARKHYEDMVPLIRTAIAIKEAEYEAEAPVRAALISTLAAREGIDLDDAESEIDDAIRWWKVGHRYARPLAQSDESIKEASVAILAEWEKRRKDRVSEEKAASITKRVKAQVPDVMVIAKTRSGFVAWSVTDEQAGPWLTKHSLSAKGDVTESEEWVTIPTRTQATMQVIYSTEGWKKWDRYPDTSKHLTGAERDEILAALRERLDDRGATPILITEQAPNDDIYDSHPGNMVAFGWEKDADVRDRETYKRRNYNSRDGIANFMTVIAAVWERKKGSIDFSFVEARHRGVDMRWGHYSAGDMGLPYREKGDRHERVSDSFLAWVDDDQFERVKEVHRWHKEFDDHESDERGRQREEMLRVVNFYRDSIKAQWVADTTAQARKDFVIDFGEESARDDDLWKHHLSTLRIEERYREPYGMFDVLSSAASNSVNMAGKTVREIVELHNTELSTKTVAVKGFDESVLSITLGEIDDA